MKLKLNEAPKYLCSLLPSQSENNDINIEYILSRETVIAQQDYICGIIGTPTTIIQFYPDGNDGWDRLDSKVSAINLRPSCDLLRRCINNGGKLCLGCDKQHAEFFHKMTYDNIESGELEDKIEKKEWDEIYRSPCHHPQREKKNRRSFLSYNCPMLGYCELIFPIFFEEKVVAVFFVGQIKLAGRENEIESIKKSFFQDNPGIFDAYLKECEVKGHNKTNPEKYTKDAIEKYITQSKRRTKPDYPELYSLKQGLQIPAVEDQLSQRQFDEMLENICKWLYDLEEMLDKEMRRKRENYTRYVLAEALAGFHADLADTDNSHPIQKALWTPVQAYTKKLTEQCALEYMAVYGVQFIGKKEVSSLKIVALSNSELYSVVPVSFFLEDSPLDSMIGEPSDSRTTPELFNALNTIPSDKEQSRMSIVFQPMKEISAASVAILVKYAGNTLKESIEDALVSGLQNLAALISLRLAVWFENAAQQTIKDTLRLYKHEMVNLTSGISRAIHDYLGNPKLKEIDLQKLNDVYRDAADTLSMFEFLSKNISILIGDTVPPEKKDVSIYQELLYKWENNKRVDARDKGCDVKFRKSHVNIYTDPRYAEIVVYNLLTNAVKYAYDNTMIYMHCVNPLVQDYCVLSVTNFTFSIRGDARWKIFEMGYRTLQAREYYPEGSGIGLSLVQRAMKILGGTVRLCEPEWISDYNIPLLYAYVNNPDFYASAGTVGDFEEAKEEYKRLSNKYITNDLGEYQNQISWVISEYNWRNPTRSLVETELYRATYKIRFEVEFYG